MSPRILTALTAVLVITFSLNAAATILYCAPGASNGTGSIDAPYGSLSECFAAGVASGGVVVCQALPGTYWETNVLFCVGNPSILIRGSGCEQTIIRGTCLATSEAVFADLTIGDTLSNTPWSFSTTSS